MQKLVIIPSLNPDQKLITLINGLISNNILPSDIIVINDGSDENYDSFFNQVSELGCTLLKHPVNLGKGQALKTAFAYVLDQFSDPVSIVCADADGQHKVTDIIALANKTKPNTLVLGCRQFDDKSIPLRSRVGNKVTRSVFKTLCGVSVSDTQTGLRAMQSDVIRKVMLIAGSRFEYEMNMLIETREREIDILQVPISTIYIEENKTSHFNPFKDSLRIYRVFGKFVLSSLLGFLVDIALFTVIFELSTQLLPKSTAAVIAAIIARVISSLVNYTVNKKSVFKFKADAHKKQKRATLIKYAFLCTTQLACSTLLVNILQLLSFIYVPIMKVGIDTLLFILSFQIQREWVFKLTKTIEKSI